jgi:hypothetical protein
MQKASEHKRLNKGSSFLTWRWNKWGLLTVFLVIISYSASVTYGFVSDDRAFLVNNNKLTSQAVSEYFHKGVWEFSTFNVSKGQLYRPLALLNYRLQSNLFGEYPRGYHIINISAHLLVTYLVFMLLSLLIPASSVKSLALATSVFAVHPVHVESVCWILGSNDVWATLWSLAAIILLFRYKHKNELIYAILAMVAVFAAMLTKELAYILPGLIAISLFYRKDKFPLKHILVLSVISGLLLGLVLLFRKGAVESPEFILSSERFVNAFAYLLGYVKMTVLPLPQKFFLTDPSMGVVAKWEIVLGISVVIGYCILFWKRKDGRILLFISAIWYILILLPGLAASFHAFRSTYASRLLYFALFPLSMIILWLLDSPDKKFSRFMERFVMTVIMVFMVITVWTGFTWKNQGSFLQLAMKSTPDNFALHIDMGDYYMETGKPNEAIRSYENAANNMASTKARIPSHQRLGEIYGKNNQLEKAQLQFEAILMIDSLNPSGLNGLGNIAALKGDLHTAKKSYEKVLKFHPADAIAKNNLELVNRQIAAEGKKN